MIEAYAPNRENDTKRYQDTVAQNSGVSLDTRLGDMTSDQQVAVMNAMHGMEGNTTAAVFDDKTGERLWTLDKGNPNLSMMFENALGAVRNAYFTGLASPAVKAKG